MSKRPTRWYTRKLVEKIARNNWGANRRDTRRFVIRVKRNPEVDMRARYNLYYQIHWDKDDIPQGARMVDDKVNPRILELNSPWIKALLSLEREGFLESNMTKKEFRIQVALGLDPEWSFICPADYQEIKRVEREYTASRRKQEQATRRSYRNTVVTFA